MQNHKPDLVRAIGRCSLAALMLNIMIGGGVFGLPGTVAGILGSQSPIAYLVAALGMAIIAACFAEVASRFQQAGGPYLYAKVAFGRFVGLQVGWLLWLTRVSAAAAVANIFLDYLLVYFPQIKGPLPRLVILSILIGGLAVINIRGVRMGTQVSNFLTVAKLLPLMILLFSGLYFVELRAQSVYATPESHPIGAWMRAVLLIVFSYSGFEAALVPAAEVEDPTHDSSLGDRSSHDSGHGTLLSVAGYRDARPCEPRSIRFCSLGSGTSYRRRRLGRPSVSRRNGFDYWLLCRNHDCHSPNHVGSRRKSGLSRLVWPHPPTIPNPLHINSRVCRSSLGAVSSRNVPLEC